MNYQNLVASNPLVNRFNGYMQQNPAFVPFQNNQLMNQNVHVMNNLNNNLRDHRNQNNQNNQMRQPQIEQMQSYQNQNQNNAQSRQRIPNRNNNRSNNASTRRGMNIIEEMLKPQKIIKGENKDVAKNYKSREQAMENYRKKKENIQITNTPYKSIIKDKIIDKKVEDVKLRDLVVHKTGESDRNKKKFVGEFQRKRKEGIEINDELKLDFSVRNYNSHKKKFEYKESYIRNLAYEENTFDETKQDYIQFYEKHQKEAEKGKKICDDILYDMGKSGIISSEELPIAPQDAKKSEVDDDEILREIEDKPEKN